MQSVPEGTRKELDHIITRHIKVVKSYRVHRGLEAPANTDQLPPLQSNLNFREGKQQLSLGLTFSVSEMTMLLQMNSALHSRTSLTFWSIFLTMSMQPGRR